MTKTFIYGVPHGFDFYEKDAGLNDYFKGFYISSRRGRRLLVNRRDNGETIYSYLRYGLKEVDRQPLHSFFGMSLVVDNYQFCPNFKVLLEWFDYLFNKLVNEHNIIKMNDDGILHYVVHKFDENTADVEWLKSNLPNILKAGGQTQLDNYDTSFVDGKAGQIFSFNQPVGENRLLETFKKYRWLSVSSEIIEKEVVGVSGSFSDSGTIELNYEELNTKLNEFNQQLLPIAVDISKGAYSDLKCMYDDVQDISTSLSKYLPMIDDAEEKEKFSGLEAKYNSLKESIGKLLEKFTSSTGGGTPQPPKSETQYCFSCKQNKPLSHFSSLDATKCKECEEQERRRSGATGCQQAYRVCVTCGKRKPARYFNKEGVDLCDDCVKAQAYKKPDPEPSFDIIRLLTSKGFLGALFSIVVIAVIVFVVINFPNSCSTHNVGSGGGGNESSEQPPVTVTDKNVDKTELDKLISTKDFKGIYDYVVDKKDATNYKRYIKHQVQQYLLSIIDTPLSTKEGVLVDFGKFYVDNFQLLEFIDFENHDKVQWEQFANDYFFVLGILREPKITQQEKNKANEILAQHPDLLPNNWMSLLANVQTFNPNAANGKVISGVITVCYTSSKNQTKTDTISGHCEKFIKPGTFVTFKFPNGDIKTNKEKTGRMNERTFKPDNKIIVYCGEYGITITPKSNRRFEE